jgi:hypothetical protein
MKCYGCNDTGHLYQACPLCRRTEVAAPTTNPTSWEDIVARGRRTTWQVSNNEAGMVQHSKQQERVTRVYEEPCTSYSLDGESNTANEHVQLDGTTKEESCDNETPSTWACPAVESASNEPIRMENSGAAMEEWGEAATLPMHTIQHQTPREVTQMDMEGQGRGESEIETEVMVTNSAPFRSDAEDVNASPPTNPKRPKKLKVERRGSQTRNRSTSKVRTKMTTM